METSTRQKRCTSCAQFKPIENFCRNRTRPDGRAHQCKSCKSLYMSQWQRERKITEVMSLVGLSRDEYNEAHKQQEGKCAICGRPETSKNQWGIKKLAVDHDHTTNKFRGLLCRSCNIKLAVLEDHAFYVAAQAYLTKHDKSS